MAKILIVDDRAINREFLVTLLGYGHHQTLEATDGAEALERVRAEHPDLVICDVLMPRMDGYEFVRQLRADDAIANTRVIFFSASYFGREAHDLAKAGGVLDVLTKPCAPEEIIRVVDQALARSAPAALLPQSDAFEQEHLRLITDKLSEKEEEQHAISLRLERLVELNLKLGSESDPLRLLDTVCEDARTFIGAMHAMVAVRELIDNDAIYFSTAGITAELGHKINRPRLDQGIFGGVLKGRPYRGADPSGGPQQIGLPAGYPQARSYLAVPITSLKHVYGWICLTEKTDGVAFSADDERQLSILAAQVGRIYENGSLYAKVQRHSKDLQQEIVERKRVEEEIRETRNFLASIFDNIPNSIFIKDARNLQFVRVNAACEKLTGYSEKEFMGKSDYDFFPKEQADFFVAKDRETLAGLQRVFIVDEAITSKDGTTRILQTKKFPMLDKDGHAKFLLGMSEDITERKQAEESLRERARIAALGADIGAALTRGESIEETLQLCCEAIVGHLHAAFARIWTLNEREDILELRASAGMYVHLDGPHGRVPVGKFKIGLIAQERKPHLTNQVVGDPRVGDQEWAKREGMVAFAGYPLLVEDHLVGVVAMFARNPLADVTLQGLASIANNIALGIERKRAEARIRESEAKYRGLIDQASDGIFVSDTEGNYLLVNARGCELLGYAEHELVGMNAKKTYLEEERGIHTERLEQIRSGQTLRFERMVKRKDGSTFPAEISLKMLDTGTVQAIFHDISARRSQELKIARLSRIHLVLSGINSAIVRIRARQELFTEACRIAVDHGGFSIGWIAKLDHTSGTLVPVAQAGLAMDLGAGGEASNRPLRLVPGGTAEVALREMRPAFDNDIESGLAGMQNAGADTLSVRRAAIRLGAKSVIVLPLYVEGKTFGILTLYAPDRNFFDDEELKLLTELAGDISFGLEFIAKEEKVDFLAYYDTLTGLANRSLFFDRLTHQLGSAARERLNVALVLIDVDRFRLVNDSLGRQAGDALLAALALRIKESFRDQDTLARVGADSFAVAVSGNWGAQDAGRFLELHNRQLFGQPFLLGKEGLRVSATLGVAVFPDDGDSPETLFGNAEAALKKAKSSGERLLFYGPEMNARVADSLRLENRLRQALDNGEMALWYQPKVSAKTRSILGFEALMRWRDPETGMVPPAKFIPLMEQTGLILEAGRWAMLQVARDCERWAADGFKPPRVAVNVSPIQLRQKDFVATVVEAAQKTEEVGSMLDIEITESVIMENVETIIPKLQTIRGLGVEIAVDDFGTGYSSLAYIARLPIHDLKIDRSFIVGMTQSEDSLTIVKSVISLAHSLRLNVVAEGVETEEQAALLLELGCDEMQGYLISKPVAPEQVPDLLRRQGQSAPEIPPTRISPTAKKSGDRKKDTKRR